MSSNKTRWKARYLGKSYTSIRQPLLIVSSYAASFMRQLSPTLNAGTPGRAIKSDAFFQYAKHDEHMVSNPFSLL
jgi:lysyl-tRNA synthetase class I